MQIPLFPGAACGLAFCLLLSQTHAAPSHGHRECGEHVTALASGIHLNIQGQYAEYNGTLKLLDIASTQPFDKAQYLVAKGELISDIQAGMNIRLFNQQIAPKNSPALPGLAKYQAAQQPEAAIANGLTGDPNVDRKELETLKGDIMNGIKLNEMNLKNATQDCDFRLNFPSPQFAA